MALPQIKHLKDYDRCPECGNTEIQGIRIGNGFGTHCNGEWRETIKFHCGAEYEYSPNFSRVVCNKPCRQEGVYHAYVDVTLRLRLRVRKDVNIKDLKQEDIFKVPGNNSLYMWNADSSDWKRKADVVRVDVLKKTQLKKAK